MNARPGLSALTIVVCAAGALACGPAAEPAQTAPQPAPVPPLHEGPLFDFVPAAGLRWMAVGRPRDIANDRAFMSRVEKLIAPKRLDAYAKATGVDLRETPEALAAGFDFGTLYAAKTVGNNERVEELFVERLIAGATTTAPHPRVRVVTGVVGRTPETLTRIDDSLIAVAVGDPMPAKVVALFAMKKLRRSPPALRGAALSALPPELGTTPMTAYFAGPFEGRWAHGARGLLASAVAIGVTAEPRADDSVRVTAHLAGDWSTSPDAPARLLAAWDDLADSTMGRLLGLVNPRSAPILSATDEILKLRVELNLPTLIDGLHAAVAADVEEIMNLGDEPRPTPGAGVPPPGAAFPSKRWVRPPSPAFPTKRGTR